MNFARTGPRIAGACLLIAAFVAAAQAPDTTESAMAATKTVAITRVATPPVIDGVIDEPVWQLAEVIGDFLLTRPIDGAEPSEPTEIRLLYDDDNLYISGRMFDRAPEDISANVMTHGSGLGQDDRIAIVIDPFNSGRNGYRFETNANGIRHEALYTNITEFQSEWEIIWDAAASVDEEGWSFEISIPFKSLPFNPNIDTWGFNFGRAIRRRGEEAVWVSRNRAYNPSIMGQVTGFEGMDQGAGLDIVTSATAGRRRVFATGMSESNVEPSLDLFYRITPSLNGSLTLNTDFSATEVDDRQVNLTRFNLFFPEKRNFFLNDSDLFEFGRIGTSENRAASGASRQSGRPFFSRRLGLSGTGQEVDIEYGGKLSGRVGRFSIGALAIRQDDFRFVDAGGAAQTIEGDNILVSRIQADVLSESSVGMVLTDGDPTSNLDNSLTGYDFLYRNSRLPGGRLLEAQAWYQHSETEVLPALAGDAAEVSAAAYGFGFSVPNAEGFRGGASMQEIENDFNPALGFVDRTGVREYRGDLGFTKFVNSERLESAFFGFDFQRVDRIAGGLESEVFVGRLLELRSNARDRLELNYTTNKESVASAFIIYRDTSDPANRFIEVPAGDYAFNEVGFELNTGNQRGVAGGFNYSDGDFYGGTRLNIGANVVWRPSPQFNMRFSYDWNDIELPQGAFVTRLTQLRAEYVFSLKLSWSNLIQYDNLSENVGFNSRLRWVPRAGQEGFIVLNHNLQDIDRDNRFDSTLSDLSVKFSYTFRF